MSINALYKNVLDEIPGSEERLFESLSDSFGFFVQQRIWSEQDAKDVVQEALATIAGKYESIDFETSFAAWAYRVLQNKVLEYYRRKQCRESKFAQLTDEGSDSNPSDPDPTLRNRLLGCLKKIGQANSKYARVLNFKYQGYPTEEICDRMEMTRNGLYIVLSRARSLLKVCLQTGDVS